MVQFKVGDTISLCAAVHDICGLENRYFIGDINAAIGSCPITIDTSTCLNLSDVQLEFQWVNSRASTETHSCADTTKLKVLGSGFSDSQGVVSMSHIISQNDLDLFKANPIFDLRVCIKGRSSAEVTSFGEVRNKFHSGDDITINLCVGVTCPDQCIGPDLWKMKCNPTTGQCIQDILLEQNSIICTATHYIEYDLSSFPSEFLDLISTNILFISDKLGGYLPLGSNIQFLKATYDSIEKKFRMYFKYTPSLSTLSAISSIVPSTILLRDVRYIYNSSTGKIETLVTLTDMVSVAIYVTGILTLLFVLILGLLNPWIAIFGIVIEIALLSYKLIEIAGETSAGSGPTTPESQIKVVQEYVDTYLSPNCDILWPTCVSTPPTCDANTMRAYLACIGPARWSQCQQAKAKAGLPLTDCDIFKTEIQTVDSCLANGTCTSSQAKDRITNNVVNPVKEVVKDTIALVTCPTDQIYNKDTHKCEDICWIPNPIGGCILTARTGKTMLLTGGLLVGGYMAYRLATRPKSPKPQEIVVKTK